MVVYRCKENFNLVGLFILFCIVGYWNIIKLICKGK